VASIPVIYLSVGRAGAFTVYDNYLQAFLTAALWQAKFISGEELY